MLTAMCLGAAHPSSTLVGVCTLSVATTAKTGQVWGGQRACLVRHFWPDTKRSKSASWTPSQSAVPPGRLHCAKLPATGAEVPTTGAHHCGCAQQRYRGVVNRPMFTPWSSVWSAGFTPLHIATAGSHRSIPPSPAAAIEPVHVSREASGEQQPPSSCCAAAVAQQQQQPMHNSSCCARCAYTGDIAMRSQGGLPNARRKSKQRSSRSCGSCGIRGSGCVHKQGLRLLCASAKAG
eukprot:242848-Chlamydomonas_euryale.AAC.2